jgi:hypothetical protein
MAGIDYFFGALILGVILLQVGLYANRSRTNARAKMAEARDRGLHSRASGVDGFR